MSQHTLNSSTLELQHPQCPFPMPRHVTYSKASKVHRCVITLAVPPAVCAKHLFVLSAKYLIGFFQVEVHFRSRCRSSPYLIPSGHIHPETGSPPPPCSVADPCCVWEGGRGRGGWRRGGAVTVLGLICMQAALLPTPPHPPTPPACVALEGVAIN